MCRAGDECICLHASVWLDKQELRGVVCQDVLIGSCLGVIGVSDCTDTVRKKCVTFGMALSRTGLEGRSFMVQSITYEAWLSEFMAPRHHLKYDSTC